jgi:hypothetical protein
MKEIVTKDSAIKNGLHKYFTGNPCKNGHLSERYTSSGGCLKCIDEARGVTGNAELLRIDKELREQARIKGKLTYISEKSCSKGHILKYTLQGRCVECSNLRRIKSEIKRGLRANE